MRYVPLIPLQVNGGASGDFGMPLAIPRVQVADDVGIAIILRRDETGITCSIWPTNDRWRWVLERSSAWIESWIALINVSPVIDRRCKQGYTLFPSNDNALDEAMRRYARDTPQEGEGGSKTEASD